MSPTGDHKFKSPRKGPANVDGVASSGVAPSSRLSQEISSTFGSETLPLRLALSKGGLGIELTRSVNCGPVCCEQLELGILGLSYPLDLSKGVKQFRARRTELRRIQLLIDLPELALKWAEQLRENWGPTVAVRLQLHSGRTAETERGNDNLQAPFIAVTIHTEEQVLAFDLVIASGTSARLLVDYPRAVAHAGLKDSPLRMALLAVDRGLNAQAGLLSLQRRGRFIEFSGLAQGVCLELLPAWGFRVPLFRGEVVTDLQGEHGALRLTLAEEGESFLASSRALSLSSSAEFLRQADEKLAGCDFEGARKLYLEALEQVPLHRECLASLAELDLATQERAEAALSFVEEMESSVSSELRAALVRRELLLASALERTGRSESAKEALGRAHANESDSILFAHLSMELLERAPPKTRLSLLSEALSRYPSFVRARRARLQLALTENQILFAESDTSHLLALASTAQKGEVCIALSQEWSSAGHDAEATRLMKLALRHCPDDPKVMCALAKSLIRTNEKLRAGELLASATREIQRSLVQEGQTLEIQRQLKTLREEADFISSQLLLENGDASGALAHLCRVESRSQYGGAARLFESEIFHDLVRFEDRDRALHRFFEALELSWLDVHEHHDAFLRLVEKGVVSKALRERASNSFPELAG